MLLEKVQNKSPRKLPGGFMKSKRLKTPLRQGQFQHSAVYTTGFIEIVSIQSIPLFFFSKRSPIFF